MQEELYEKFCILEGSIATLSSLIKILKGAVLNDLDIEIEGIITLSEILSDKAKGVFDAFEQLQDSVSQETS